MPTTRIPLSGDQVDPADVTRVAEAIRDQRSVVLPTETVYGLVADPRSQESQDRARDLKGRTPDQLFTHHIADRAALEALVDHVPAPIERLIDRYWPGPLTVVLPGIDGANVGVRMPAHSFTQAVLKEFAPSLYLTSVNRSGAPDLLDPDAILNEFGDSIDLIVDDGPSTLGQASTVIRWQSSGEIEILREGALSERDIWEHAATRILFLCSGNTCRSPLAEAAARRAVAKTLGTTDDRVLAHGFWFQSAGLGAGYGSPASDGSRTVAKEAGLDLEDHSSQPLTAELCEQADKIYCLGPSHLAALQQLDRRIAEKAELLDPEGSGVPDPFGGDLDIYRKAREAITKAVEKRIKQQLAALV
ncbi:MAG: Sua5/YciO/YrdC/YwlC family protein [Planctomycetota bacterium]